MKQLLHWRLLDMSWLNLNHLISNERPWNNCLKCRSHDTARLNTDQAYLSSSQ